MLSGEEFAEVSCPYCGESSTVDIEPDSQEEEFVLDCPVCCRPWRVRVRFHPDGSAEVSVEAEGG